MATVVVKHHPSGGPADSSALVDGPAYDADPHIVTGLENVDNTSDVNKPTSTTQAASIATAVAAEAILARNAANLTSGTILAARMPALTGDVTSTVNTVGTTLATVNVNTGAWGSATQAPVITLNGKGLAIAASNITITPAVGSITGFGTGVGTALAINVGTAGAPVINGGALGSPSTAGTLPAHTLGGTISGGGNQINNVVIGTTTPLAGAFTTLTSGPHTITSSSASALTAGLNGATNPALQVDASTASSATGIQIKSLAAAGGVAINAISSGTNEPMAINAKGSGAIAVGNVSSGGVQLAAGGGGVGITGNLTFSPTTAGPVGTTTNDSAAAGIVGEYVESIVTGGAPVAITSGTPKTITSITLSAGDWDVDLLCLFLPANTTSVTSFNCSLSLVTNTLDTTPGRIFSNNFSVANVFTGASTFCTAIPPYRFSLSGSTTIFFVAQDTHTVSTSGAFGIIRARRVR